jgi:hypothetical protein
MDKDNAPFFELQNDGKPNPTFKAHYGDQYVPHPCNAASEKVHPDKVMEAVLRAK